MCIRDRGHTALEETVHQNPVLEKVGVVDAGGFGFITIFEGMLDALRGIHKERAVAAEPTKSSMPSKMVIKPKPPASTTPAFSSTGF